MQSVNLQTSKPRSTLLKHITHNELSVDEIEALHLIAKPQIKHHLFDIKLYLKRKDECVRYSVVRDSEQNIIGMAAYRTSHTSKSFSTTSLYNIFSTQPGTGGILLNAYWEHAVQNSRWFKFFIDIKAHNFYSKYNTKYWCISKTGQTFGCVGLICDPDMKKSMLMWEQTIGNINSNDMMYLQKIVAMFDKKHVYGIKKASKNSIQLFEQNKLTIPLTYNKLDV